MFPRCLRNNSATVPSAISTRLLIPSMGQSSPSNTKRCCLPTAPKGGLMWILSKQWSQAHSELETLILERTAELQRLSQRLLKVQDEERRKIARDLHDSTGQTLAALRISISSLEANFREDPATLALVADVAQLVDQAIEEIRTMSYLLHPPLLDEVGFACAAEWYIDGFAKRSGIKVKADIANSRERLPKRMEIALFRVLQESL